MEVADLVSHTEKISCEESRLELPPSHDPTLSPDLNLIGKLITSKDTGLKYVKDIALRAWKPVYSMEVKRLDKNIFMFSFQHEVDAHRAFLSRPWSCRGGHLILKRWSLDITWQEVNFSTSTFWVQVHGLPTLWRIENNLIKIEGRLGQVLKANIVGDPGGCWKKFLRVRVDIPIEKPLLPGFFLPRPKKSDIWIGLKYEKVADICYKCGIIGHEEKSCEGNLFQLCNLKGTSFNAAGPWIRAGNDDYPPDAFACTEVPASASGSTKPSSVHAQAVTDCPILAVQPKETLAPSYCTTPKDSTVSSIPYQTWQAHTTPTTLEPPNKSTNANAQPQPVPDTGPEVSIPQYTKAIEPSAHESPITTNQTLGFRNLFCLTQCKWA